MWRRLSRWLTVIFLAAIFSLPMAQAQPPLPQGGAGAEIPEERSPPALQYAVAILSTILVMVVVCAPTRKSVK